MQNQKVFSNYPSFWGLIACTLWSAFNASQNTFDKKSKQNLNKPSRYIFSYSFIWKMHPCYSRHKFKKWPGLTSATYKCKKEGWIYPKPFCLAPQFRITALENSVYPIMLFFPACGIFAFPLNMHVLGHENNSTVRKLQSVTLLLNQVQSCSQVWMSCSPLDSESSNLQQCFTWSFSIQWEKLIILHWSSSLS